MKPSNDRETTIASRVDRQFLDDPYYPFHLIVRDIAMTLDFILSPDDTRFLVHYTHWRDANPLSAPNFAAQLEAAAQ